MMNGENMKSGITQHSHVLGMESSGVQELHVVADRDYEIQVPRQGMMPLNLIPNNLDEPIPMIKVAIQWKTGTPVKRYLCV
jgi:hypothetical protein